MSYFDPINIQLLGIVELSGKILFAEKSLFSKKKEIETWVYVEFPNRIARSRPNKSADHVNICTVYRQRMTSDFWRLKLSDVQLILLNFVRLNLKLIDQRADSHIFQKPESNF